MHDVNKTAGTLLASWLLHARGFSDQNQEEITPIHDRELGASEITKDCCLAPSLI